MNTLVDVIKYGSRTIHSKVRNGTRKYVPKDLDGCVLYLPMDEKTVNLSLDMSGQNNHGTIYGAIETDGIINKGLYLDGLDDFIDCGNHSSLQFNVSDSFSLVAWIKTTDSNGFRIINKKGGIDDRGWDLVYISNYLRFHIIDSNTNNRRIRDATGLNLNDGNKHLIVATYDGSGNISGMKIYIDGAEVLTYFTYSNIGTLSNIESGEPLCIGTQHNSNYFYKGMFDEIRVYKNRILSLEKIKAMYEQES